MDIKISIVIPVFNASNYIVDTLSSIQKQQITPIEIIIVNDGSTDDSIKKAADFFAYNSSIRHVIIHNDCNKGVSFSRNAGLLVAEGKYIAFIDADDLLSDTFLLDRYNFLEQNVDYLGCCSLAKTFYDNDKDKSEQFLGAAVNLKYDILTYQRTTITCPSNYLFKKKSISDNHIHFNEKLSSSADRYFLLTLGDFGKIAYIDSSPLYYRIQEHSMSHKLTINLLKDNELFKHEVLEGFKLEKNIRVFFLYKVNYILGGGYFKLGKYMRSVAFIVPSIYYFVLHKTIRN